MYTNIYSIRLYSYRGEEGGGIHSYGGERNIKMCHFAE